ncbi:MAG: hypothetical protein WD934_07995 [Gemmatimonadales bacterium]
MDIGLLVTRFLHIVLGSYWVGAIFFNVLFLMPAMVAAGPDSAKVQQGIQQRGFMKWTPIAAILVILTGIDLLRRISANFQPEWFGSRVGMTYSIGMAATIVAFIVGFFFMRPLMLKAATLPPAEAGPVRMRAMRLSQVVAVLLFVAVTTMAVARYV